MKHNYDKQESQQIKNKNVRYKDKTKKSIFILFKYYTILVQFTVHTNQIQQLKFQQESCDAPPWMNEKNRMYKVKDENKKEHCLKLKVKFKR